MSDSFISLNLNAAVVDVYCRDLVRRTSSVEKRIVSLDALRTFFAVQVSPADQLKPEYAAMRLCLDEHFEQARNQLQQQQCDQFIGAIKQRSISRLVGLYQALSRDAFWQMMQEAKRSLGNEANEEIGHWSSAWLGDVEKRSAVLSPYPDAIDFKAVGIEVVDYSLMRDIASCFATTRVETN